MDKQTEIKILRLQDALSSLRKTAGWSAERLGQELDVTRQTIVNLETGKAKMSKVQYLAIRSVFDTEADVAGKETISKLLSVLVDQNIPEKSRKELKETIEEATKKVGSRSGATVAGTFALAAAAAFLGIVLSGPLGVGAAVTGLASSAFADKEKNHNVKDVH